MQNTEYMQYSYITVDEPNVLRYNKSVDAQIWDGVITPPFLFVGTGLPDGPLLSCGDSPIARLAFPRGEGGFLRSKKTDEERRAVRHCCKSAIMRSSQDYRSPCLPLMREVPRKGRRERNKREKFSPPVVLLFCRSDSPIACLSFPAKSRNLPGCR